MCGYKPLFCCRTVGEDDSAKNITPKENVSNLRHEEVSTSVNVIGKTVYEAIPEIDKFLNDCIMAGVSPVQIIHGKGREACGREFMIT